MSTVIASNKNSFNSATRVITTAGLGMFLSTLDSGIINVALPSLQHYFHTTTTVISWTINLYLLMLSISIIIFGRLSDRFGRVRIFKIGMLIFAISSFFCGFSKNIIALIIYRGIQGLGAAMIQATAAALITTLLPKERRASGLGVLSSIMGLGPILGPAIAGICISCLSWRWLFIINLPLCCFGLWQADKLTDNFCEKYIRLDYKSNILLAIWMCSITLCIVLLPNHITQYSILLILFSIALISLALFIWHENTSINPILKLNLFSNPEFSSSLWATLAFGFTTAIMLIIPPFYLETAILLLPWQVGFFSLCLPLGLVCTARFSGQFIKIWGTQRLMRYGFILILIALSILTVVICYHNLFWLFPLVLITYGIGGGLFQPANMHTIMNSVTQDHQGTISAVNRMIHNFGNVLGVAIAMMLMQINAGFFVAPGLGLIIICIAFIRLYLVKQPKGKVCLIV